MTQTFTQAALTGVGAHALATDLLERVGLPAARARRTADILVLADRWGVHSHGLSRLPHYLRRLVAGGHDAHAEVEVASDTGPVVALRGHRGLGHWQAWEAAELAVERARTYGVGVVTVSDSGHCGALGTYVLPGLRHDLLTLVFSNGPAVMAPWGGSAPVLSTSPLAAGVPSRPQPVVVDLATTAVARGRIAVAASRGEELPEGWALDRDGLPTTDASVALMGLLAPLGGAKGFALALLVESLTGGVAGPALATEVADMFRPDDDARAQGIAHTVVTLDPARLDPDGGAGARARLDALAASVGSGGGRLPGAARTALLDDLEIDTPPDTPLGLEPQVETHLHDWATRLQATPPEE